MQLPDGYRPQHVRDAPAEKINSIPDVLSSSLTRDQGPQLRDRKHVSVDADIEIYLRDPHAPPPARDQREHQRAAAPELPHGTDLSLHSAADPDRVAAELNDRPRKRLGFAKPIEEIGPLLLR